MRTITTLAIAALVASTGANAATIALDDWWLQTDNFGGLRQSTSNDNLYFAVSSSTTWSVADEYETPDGFTWASQADYLALPTSGPNPGVYQYFNQGGWTNYAWEGQVRYYFRFSDSYLNNGFTHAGYTDGDRNLTTQSTINNFAGIVLIRDVPAVPVPAAVWLFGSGLLGLAGVARRKKA